MSIKYKDLLIKEMEEIPDEFAKDIYQVLHILKKQFVKKRKKKSAHNSLKGIWKGSKIKESLFAEAKKSIFPYESA